jgi:transposase-like protein
MVSVIPVCPSCKSKNTKPHTHYNTQNYGKRVIHKCTECGRFFSPTFNTFLGNRLDPPPP